MNCVLRIFKQHSATLNLIPSAQTHSQAIAFLPYRVTNFGAHFLIYFVLVFSEVTLVVNVAKEIPSPIKNIV